MKPPRCASTPGPPTRRQFIAAAAAGTALAAGADATADAKTRPNILFMMCDQLNARVLSCYGGPVPTPNIDRIAREGVRFTDAVCPTPFCSPTRASMITGLYPHAHGIVYNTNPRIDGITPADVTTGKLLHAAGYQTHQYGKWHLMGKPVPYYADMYDGGQYTREMAEAFAKARKRPASKLMKWYNWPLPVTVDPRFQKAVDAAPERWKSHHFAEFIAKQGRLELPLEQHFDVRVADHTVERLGKLDPKKPFMVTCSFVAPHDPNVVPDPYYSLFDPAKLELPANFGTREARFERDWSRRILAALGEAGAREFLRIYYAMVKLIDDQVGRILKTLDATGRAGDTIVVFTADHGDMAAAHAMAWKSTTAFYDDVARVPLLIRFPGRIPPATKTAIAANQTDMMPTLLSLAGHKSPDGIQGHCLSPYITGRPNAPLAPQYTFSERIAIGRKRTRKTPPTARGHFMIRGLGWKYCLYFKDEEYLYDLTADPGETRNLTADAKSQARKAELRRQLLAWLRRTGYPGRV